MRWGFATKKGTDVDQLKSCIRAMLYVKVNLYTQHSHVRPYCLRLDRPQLNPKRQLLPQVKYHLIAMPIVASRIQFDIEVAEDGGEKEAGLVVSQILANAITWTSRKRLEGSLVVLCKLLIPV